jgi:ATP-binding cassette subfamily B protein
MKDQDHQGSKPTNSTHKNMPGAGKGRGSPPNDGDSGAVEPEIPELSNWQVIKRLLGLTWKYRSRCLQVLFFQLVLLIMVMSGLSMVGLGVDYLNWKVGDGQEPNWPFGLSPAPDMAPLTVVALISLAVFLFALLRGVMNYAFTLAKTKLVQTELVVDLRDQIFNKLQRLSFRFFDDHASGSIINRVTSDVQSLRMFVDGAVIQTFIMVLSLSVYLVYMLSIHVTLTLACLATTPLLWVAAARFSSKVKPMHRYSRELMDDLVLNFSERVQGINMVKGFALEPEVLRTFQESNDTVRDQRQEIFWTTSFYGPLIAFLPQINLFILLLYGGYLHIQGEISIGAGLLVFAALLNQFSGQITSIAGIVDSIQQSLTGARRVFEVLDAPIEVESRPDAKPLTKARGEVAFEHVWFKYKERDTVLEDINFTAKPGEVIAIAGATGSGKSALMSLIPRFYDPVEGRLLLDGQDLRDYRLEDLRRNIGLVFQENFLFSNTIASNIAYGYADATREQIEKAARIASAHDFIMEMPDGYDTLLGESGINLSGGQRQRLAIARAILLEPAILLLDDPTAAIDPETEHEILEAIENAIEGRTTFIVAHRMSTLRRADRVIVLKRGRIVQMGHHHELVKQPGPYRNAISIQEVDPESMALLSEAEKNRGTRKAGAS